MKKTTEKKLALKKETLRVLTRDELRQANGASTTTQMGGGTSVRSCAQTTNCHLPETTS
jgi:hypothetical protein